MSFIAQVTKEELTNSKTSHKSEFSKNRISLTPGLGSTYCLLGFKAQYRRTAKNDLAYEICFSPLTHNVTDSPMFGFGAKWYFFKDMHLNTNYTYQGKSNEGIHHSIASILLGFDFMKYGNNVGYGLNFGLGVSGFKSQGTVVNGMNIIEEPISAILPAFDLGFVFAFSLN
jgi:hypothetical protein